jgi:hypothetical protein
LSISGVCVECDKERRDRACTLLGCATGTLQCSWPTVVARRVYLPLARSAAALPSALWQPTPLHSVSGVPQLHWSSCHVWWAVGPRPLHVCHLRCITMKGGQRTPCCFILERCARWFDPPPHPSPPAEETCGSNSWPLIKPHPLCGCIIVVWNCACLCDC